MKIIEINGEQRVLVDYWDGKPVHRPLTPEERLSCQIKSNKWNGKDKITKEKMIEGAKLFIGFTEK